MASLAVTSTVVFDALPQSTQPYPRARRRGHFQPKKKAAAPFGTAAN